MVNKCSGEQFKQNNVLSAGSVPRIDVVKIKANPNSPAECRAISHKFGAMRVEMAESGIAAENH